jgi:polyhydroxyalkanoate synthesis repressor PhaR
MSEARVIRKYANRRLYDATASRHVTLEDIRKLIGSGENVQVVDDRSGADLTRAVLLQIISEQEQFGAPVLSVQLLEAIIRFYGNPVQDMLSRYLEQSVGAAVKQQQAMQAQMAKALETPLAPLGELARQNMELWARMQASMFNAFGQGAQPAPGSASAPAAGTSPGPSTSPDPAAPPDSDDKQSSGT